MPSDNVILAVDNLKRYFPVRSKILKRRKGWIKAIDGVSLKIIKGEIFGIVGESGCGKSTLGKTILGIYRPNDGAVFFENKIISNFSPKETKKIRKSLQYIYQDAGASLDPWWVIGRSLREPLLIHTQLSKPEMNEKIRNILSSVGLNEGHLDRYPHEFSGGQQRRIGLARILTLNPNLIIFDEPTSGLDVSVQATILKLLKKLKKDFNLTYVFISHNLAVIRMMCQRVAVMYLGKIMEMGLVEKIFNDPLHPYTKSLLSAIPEPGKRKETALLKGEPPTPENRPAGCCFWPRCPFAEPICSDLEPAFEEIENERSVACHFHKKISLLK